MDPISSSHKGPGGLPLFHMRCLKSILGIRWWHKVIHVEIRHRAADIDTAEHMLLQRKLCWIGHVIRMPSSRSSSPTGIGIIQWAAYAGWPKITLQGHIRRILNKSNIPISDLEKLATDRDTWRSACASGLSTICQVSDQAAADRRSRRHHITGPNRQQQVPDVCSAAECVPPSLAGVATFVSTFHVLHNAPSSTNVIVDVDGLLQGKARQGKAQSQNIICSFHTVGRDR